MAVKESEYVSSTEGSESRESEIKEQQNFLTDNENLCAKKERRRRS